MCFQIKFLKYREISLVSLKSRTCAVGRALGMRRSAKPYGVGMGSCQKGNGSPYSYGLCQWQISLVPRSHPLLMADLGSDSVPEEIEEPCTRCHYALSGIEQTLHEAHTGRRQATG